MSRKVVLITGSSTGFGRLAAEKLARRGHAVYATMRGVAGANAGAAAELTALAEAEGLTLVPLELDVTDAAGVERAVADVVAREGRIDVVVNNAGAATMGLSETFTPEDVERQLAVNVLGPHRVNRAVLPHMRGAGTGRIVHISSTAGRLVIPAMGPYCASKFALEAMAEALRLELAPLGVESTVIEPGAFPTPILGKIGGGSDTGRADTYGALADLPGRLGEGLGAYLSGPDAPDAGEVADVIVAQVEAAPGSVPFRTRVGADTAPLEALNEAAAASQDELLRGFGLAELAEAAAVANPA
jgi:NAD(P)-dependent dehydrogenase (short-subunit alcohol dehydrogenase family)